MQSGKNILKTFVLPEAFTWNKCKLYLHAYTKFDLSFCVFSFLLTSRTFVIAVLYSFVCLLSINIPQVHKFSFILIESFQAVFFFPLFLKLLILSSNFLLFSLASPESPVLASSGIFYGLGNRKVTFITWEVQKNSSPGPQFLIKPKWQKKTTIYIYIFIYNMKLMTDDLLCSLMSAVDGGGIIVEFEPFL